MTYAENILLTYSRANANDIAEGMEWYSRANSIATYWAKGDTAKGAGIIAVYSPNMPWVRNLEIAKKVLHSGEVYRGYIPVQVAKAERILAGENPIDILGGLKTTAFAQSIIDGGNGDVVCVDRHALDIAFNRIGANGSKGINAGLFRRIAMHYQQAAYEIGGITPQQLQAITWVTWRREKGIV